MEQVKKFRQFTKVLLIGCCMTFVGWIIVIFTQGFEWAYLLGALSILFIAAAMAFSEFSRLKK